MSDFDNTNRGVLFKNDEKKTDNHPDYNGSININGVDHWLSAWIQTSKKGAKYMSLSIGSPKEQQEAKPETSDEQFEDSQDIPFS